MIHSHPQLNNHSAPPIPHSLYNPPSLQPEIVLPSLPSSPWTPHPHHTPMPHPAPRHHLTPSNPLARNSLLPRCQALRFYHGLRVCGLLTTIPPAATFMSRTVEIIFLHIPLLSFCTGVITFLLNTQAQSTRRQSRQGGRRLCSSGRS